MDSTQQLIKKDIQEGKYKNIYPKTYTDIVKDRETNESLNIILQRNNFLFLTYQGSREDTRLLVPLSMRRRGLWLGYLVSGSLVVEYFNNNEISDEYWRDGRYWLPYNTAEYQPNSVNLSALAQEVYDYFATQISNSVKLNSEDLSRNTSNEIQLADKSYDSANFSGLGRIYLRKNIVNKKNILTQDMISEANTRYIIQYDYDLNGESITIPDNCVLVFDGGSIVNGKIVGTNSRLHALSYKILDTNILLSGTWNIKGLYAEWFGAVNNKDVDSYEALNATVLSCDSIEVPLLIDKNTEFMVTQTLNLPRFGVIGGGKNKCAIYSNISNATNETMAFVYGASNNWHYNSVIKGVSFKIYDTSNSSCNVLNICTPSRGARLEDCGLLVGSGSCVVLTLAFYYEFNNVTFSGEWVSNPSGNPYHGIGFSFGQDGSEINNITFNKCDFKDLLEFCHSYTDAFTGSNTIAVNDTAIERIGEGLGSLNGMNIVFNSCYLENFNANETISTSYSIALTGSGKVKFYDCLLNFGTIDPDKPLFLSHIGKIIMDECSVVLPSDFSSNYIISPIGYSSRGILEVYGGTPFAYLKPTGSPPIYEKLLSQHFNYPRSEELEHVYSSNMSEAELAFRTIERIVRRGSALYNPNQYQFLERIAGHLMFYNVDTRYFLIVEGELHLFFNNEANDYVYIRQKQSVLLGGGAEYSSEEDIEFNKVEETRIDTGSFLNADFDLFKLSYIGASTSNENEIAFKVVSNSIPFIKANSTMPKDILLTIKLRMISADSVNNNRAVSFA